MKVKIPYDLKMKFLSLEGLNSEIEKDEINMEGVIQTLPGRVIHSIELDLSNEPICLKACFDWFTLIDTYFKTSYKAYRLDIGPYEGLWPVSFDVDGVVKFHVDDVDLKRKDWKDWFIKGDTIYASK